MLYKFYRKFYFYVYCCCIIPHNTNCSNPTYKVKSKRIQDFCKEIPQQKEYTVLTGVQAYAPASKKKFLFDITKQFDFYNSAIILKINSIIMCICTLNYISPDQTPKTFHSIPSKIIIELIQSMCKTVTRIYYNDPIEDKDLRIILRFILFIYSLSDPLKKEKHKDKKQTLISQRGGDQAIDQIENKKQKLRAANPTTTINSQNQNNAQNLDPQNFYDRNSAEGSYYLHNIYKIRDHKINYYAISRLISSSTLYAPFGHDQIKYDTLLRRKYESQEKYRQDLSNISQLDITDEELESFKKSITNYTQSTVINIEECVFNFTTSLLCKLIPELRNNIQGFANKIQEIINIQSSDDTGIFYTLNHSGIKEPYKSYVMMCIKMRNQLQTTLTPQHFYKNDNIAFLIQINTKKQVFNSDQQKQSIYDIFIKRRIKIRSCEILSNFYRRFFLESQNTKSISSVNDSTLLGDVKKSVVRDFSDMQLRKNIDNPIIIINYIKGNDADFLKEELALLSIEEKKRTSKQYLIYTCQEFNQLDIFISELELAYKTYQKNVLQTKDQELKNVQKRLIEHQKSLNVIKNNEAKQLLTRLNIFEQKIESLLVLIQIFLDQDGGELDLIEENNKKLIIIREILKQKQTSEEISEIETLIKKIEAYIANLQNMSKELNKQKITEHINTQKESILSLQGELEKYLVSLQIYLIFLPMKKIMNKCTKYHELIEKEDITIDQCDKYLQRVIAYQNTLKEIQIKIQKYQNNNDCSAYNSNLIDALSNFNSLKEKITAKKKTIKENLQKDKDDQLLIDKIQTKLYQVKSQFDTLEKFVIPPYTPEFKSKIIEQIKKVKELNHTLKDQSEETQKIKLSINKDSITKKINKEKNTLKKRKKILMDQTTELNNHLQEQNINAPTLLLTGFGGFSLIGFSIWKSTQSNDDDEIQNMSQKEDDKDEIQEENEIQEEGEIEESGIQYL